MVSTRKTVSFHQMKDGTKEEYAYLAKLEAEHALELPKRILNQLRQLDTGLSGYQISRLDHSLQTATRASRDGADIDWVVSALLHDLGDELAPSNHDAYAATILKPYVREECEWAVRHHGIFQLAYYGEKIGVSPEQHQKFSDHPFYESTVYFCEHWDQNSFDPNYKTEPLTFFEDMVCTVFTRPAWHASHVYCGTPLPISLK